MSVGVGVYGGKNAHRPNRPYPIPKGLGQRHCWVEEHGHLCKRSHASILRPHRPGQQGALQPLHQSQHEEREHGRGHRPLQNEPQVGPSDAR